jgi:hypothetical protein
MRVDAWLNPWFDPAGRSFQIVQSLLAVANGGLIGRGPGLGNPGLVPVAHSDFIFATIFEEIGLTGAIGLIGLIALLGSRAVRCALLAQDAFQRYLAVGLTAYLTGQSILIIAGNLRMLPLTGVTLPFVSYGGSSLLVSMLSLLILVLISNNSSIRQRPLPEPRPILQLGTLLLASLAAIAVIAGWWSVTRSSTLLARTDNARRTISDRYVRRGSLLDRENRPIDLTEGASGQMTRQIRYPDLSPIVGYTDPVYGQAGLEASLDAYLRGLAGNPLAMIWASHLLYGQPPPGVDVRTSLDLDLQQAADSLLADQKGALVLLNAQSGEILAMASHPTFNANRLSEIGQNLLQNPNSPLLNRATQGLYPAGAALGPLLLADSGGEQSLPALPGELSYSLENRTLQCTSQPDERTWSTTIAAGCPGPVAALGQKKGAQAVLDLFDGLGLYTPPQVYLPADSVARSAESDPAALALGADLRISPLQMGLAAAVLSGGGIRPAPYLATAIKEPDQGWVILPAQGKTQRILPEQAASGTAAGLAVSGQPIWQTIAVAAGSPKTEQKVTWYLGGTQPGWNGTPLALAILLEDDNPTLAEEIGQKLLRTAMGN